jgi:hypothetical protein
VKKNASGVEEEEEEGADDWEIPDVVRKLDGIVAESQPEYVWSHTNQVGGAPTDFDRSNRRDVLATTPVWHPSGKFFVIGTKAHGSSGSCSLLLPLDRVQN